MAGTKLTSRHSVPGAGILEVVVSMVIIIVIFTMAMTIYLNVTRLSLSAKELKAQSLLKESLIESEKINEFTNKSFEQDSLQIDQKVRPFQNSANLVEVTLIAYDDHNVQIATLKKIEIVYE